MRLVCHDLLIAALYFAAGDLLGQASLTLPAVPTPPGVLDVAPLSNRFPASWYPPQDLVPSTMATPAGAPYSAVLVTSQTYRDPANGAPKTSVARSLQMRDGAGRLRSESPYLSKVDTNPTRHEVTVGDPVSHCSFTWSEPLVGDLQRQATVSCMARRVRLLPDPRTEAKMRAPASEQAGPAGEIFHLEPLGHKTISGVHTIGQRITRSEAGATKPPTVTETWWSPELKDIVLLRTGVGTDYEYSLQLEDISQGEPPAALFYPPANYKILAPHLPQ